VILNMAAAYLKSAIDGRASRMSGWWHIRSEAVRDYREELIQAMVKDERAHQMIADWAQRVRTAYFQLVITMLFFTAMALAVGLARLRGKFHTDVSTKIC
jgi:hypothetical protein